MPTQSDLNQPLSHFIPQISSQEYAPLHGYSRHDVALAIVECLSLQFKSRGFEITKGGREKLREEIKKKLRSLGSIIIDDDRSLVQNEIARMVDLALAPDNRRFVFRDRYERICYVVAGNISGLMDQIREERGGRCPAWPFC